MDLVIEHHGNQDHERGNHQIFVPPEGRAIT